MALQPADLDDAVRAAAFAWLDDVTARAGGLVTRTKLEAFEFQSRRVPLIARQRGIQKVAWLECALSIMTTYTPPGQPPPYEDELGADGYPRYKWRGTDAFAYDNVALRRAMELGKPLVWFIGVRPGMYDPIYPVTLAGEEPERHQFVLAVDETMQRSWGPGLVAAAPFDPIRRYAERIVRIRRLTYERRWRTAPMRSSRGLPSAAAGHPTMSGRRPKRTMVLPSRSGAGWRPPSTCHPRARPGSRAADWATMPAAPVARILLASSRHAAYESGPPVTVSSGKLGSE